MCITDLLPIPTVPPESRRSGAGPAGGSCLSDWQDDAKACLCWTARMMPSVFSLSFWNESRHRRDSKAITLHPQRAVAGRQRSSMFNTWLHHTFFVKHFPVHKGLSSVYKRVLFFLLNLSLIKTTFWGVCFSTHFPDEERKELWRLGQSLLANPRARTISEGPQTPRLLFFFFFQYTL